ncbi:lactosylceramide 1,3-N-acetyl-beta-D-glucosaminyltransferase A-like [Aethina tumida]|uniref:lactosylceramide 1,3-N-acetyl-beta-D-glucosaminyltransferase A-like n=1 Tax=Aethina tumida TaxID=116153 RepID=UPI002148857F|nr:lactosylceramide 1,3-N-acetyl-beta-D-glucosaminyltransferase A-like [Aethina tumida]
MVRLSFTDFVYTVLAFSIFLLVRSLHPAEYVRDHPHLPKDYHQLINIDFHFGILNKVCVGTKPVLLIVVSSSGENFQKRYTIRNTWKMNDEFVQLVFALGAVGDKWLQEKINEENHIYRDIIQGNFADTYRNLPYKHIMILKYAAYHCAETKFVLKVDDDIFVNTPAMKNFIRNDLEVNYSNGILACQVLQNVTVERTNDANWKVLYNEYPKEIYPTHCDGSSILYSSDVALYLYMQAQLRPEDFFWVDNVYVTGILAAPLRSIHKNISNLVWNSDKIKEIRREIPKDPFLLGPAHLDEKQIELLWTFVQNHPVPTSFIQYINWL